MLKINRELMAMGHLKTVTLIVIMVLYLTSGALIFSYLEEIDELEPMGILGENETLILRKYNITADDYDTITAVIIRSMRRKTANQWSFISAFYFSLTIVTTIGYGHIAPSTTAGRSFCIMYALIGIPIDLLMFQSIGGHFNNLLSNLIVASKRKFGFSSHKATTLELAIINLILSTLLMCSMALMFTIYERWKYFDSFYYCFITLSTIGLGDYVALQNDFASELRLEYVAGTIIFILVGLSIVSSAVNLLIANLKTLPKPGMVVQL